MTATPVPTLTASGMVFNSAEKAYKVLQYFITTEYSQSTLYPKQLYSLPYIVYEYADDEVTLKSNLNSQLTEYLGKYFQDVSLTIKLSYPDPDRPTLFDLAIDASVADDESNYYSLGVLVEVLNSKIKSFRKVASNG